MPAVTPLKFEIPQQDLRDFTLFRPNADGAHHWSQGLPVTNTNALVDELHKALDDLNRVGLPPETRFEIMKILQPNLQVALANLSRRFLNQPLVMPEEPRKMAELGSTLCTLASTAFTIVAVEAIQQRDAIRNINPARLACEAIHHAMVFAGIRVLRTFQLYQALPANTWQPLHQLYALAEGQQLTELPVPNPLSGGASIKSTYLQTLLLSCCKPNQLRQNDLAALHRGLQKWSELVTLDAQARNKPLFLVDIASDRPPAYAELYNANPASQCRYINTTELITHLRVLKQETGKGGIRFDKDTSLPPNMLEHLIASLGELSMRNFKRVPADSVIQACVGLSSTHYHVAGGLPFEQVMHGANHEPDEADRPPEAVYPVYSVQLVNVSPGGYCLEWTAELPADIRSGDVVGLREDDNGNWAIAVIRWLSRLEEARTLMGLELLSPRAIPYGASIHKKDGSRTPPMRALLLPEIKLVGQGNTLITPRAGFSERQKVTLSNSTAAHTVRLAHQLAATGSYTHFDFDFARELGDVLAEQEDTQLGADFDSLWSNI